MPPLPLLRSHVVPSSFMSTNPVSLIFGSDLTGVESEVVDVVPRLFKAVARTIRKAQQ